MPLYDYRCTACGKVSEVRHGFNESHTAPCEACGGALTRVFNPAPIVFKGAGFYKTDSRKSASAESSSGGDASASAKTEKAEKTEKSEKTDTKKASDSAA